MLLTTPISPLNIQTLYALGLKGFIYTYLFTLYIIGVGIGSLSFCLGA